MDGRHVIDSAARMLYILTCLSTGDMRRYMYVLDVHQVCLARYDTLHVMQIIINNIKGGERCK
jgi:hypothetical protein